MGHFWPPVLVGYTTVSYYVTDNKQTLQRKTRAKRQYSSAISVYFVTYVCLLCCTVPTLIDLSVFTSCAHLADCAGFEYDK